MDDLVVYFGSLEEHLWHLKEEFSFKERVYNQELIEIRARNEMEMSEMDGNLIKEYEAKLQQSFKDLGIAEKSLSMYESQVSDQKKKL
jgi:lamin B